jgi:hypothetical protein
MQLGIGKTLFPSWAAALTLVKDHGVGAALHAKAAVKAGDGATRLDEAVLAMTNFDHAIDNTRKLPVQWFVPRAGMYYRGYEAAKQAVTLLVGSGLIPGAKERVGSQSLVAAKDAFLEGVAASRNAAKDAFLEGVAASRNAGGRFGQHLAAGWLEATAEDAITGVRLLDPVVGRELLVGINQVRAAVAQRRPLDEALVKTVGDLFDRAGSELAKLVEQAQATHRLTTDTTAMQRSAELLAEVEVAARVLVADAQAVAAANAG